MTDDSVVSVEGMMTGVQAFVDDAERLADDADERNCQYDPSSRLIAGTNLIIGTAVLLGVAQLCARLDRIADYIEPERHDA